MSVKFINLSAIASKVGVTVEELMAQLQIAPSESENELIELLKEELSEPRVDKFETFLLLAGHHIEDVSVWTRAEDVARQNKEKDD